MRRTRFLITLTAAYMSAAPNTTAQSNQVLSQISEKAYQLQAQADTLEAYVRSGSHDWMSSAGYTNDISESTQKLASLIDQFVSQPGTTNETRQRVDKMKVAVAELRVFISNTVAQLDPHSVAIHADEVLANASNIEDRGSMIRAAAQNLAGTN